jgi:hypothetical protein
LGARDILSRDESNPGHSRLFADNQNRHRWEILEETQGLYWLQTLPKANSRNTRQLRQHVVSENLPVASRQSQY